MGLKDKTIKGFGWSFADNVLNQGFRFLVGLILARLVTPHDYGLIGISLIFVSISEGIVDGGFSSALIQKSSPSEKDYGTAFVINIAASIAIYGLIYVLAPYISVFFNQDPRITVLVRVISCILMIDALMMVPKARLTKDMNFKVQTKISFISSVIAGFIGISLAIRGMGVWALVGQQLGKHGCNSLLLCMAGWRGMALGFSKASFMSLFSFGSKLLVSDFINSIYRQLYNIIIGKFYSSVTLGQYTRAHQFGSLFSLTLTQIVQKVSFPALSSIQNEKEKLREGYGILIRYVMFIDLVCMLCLAAMARPMIVTLIGSQWMEAVTYLQILCLMMMLYPLQIINLNAIKVKGRSDLILRLEIINKVIGIIPVFLGIIYNIYWMLIGSVLAEYIGYCLNSYYSGRLIGYTASQQIKDIAPSFFVALTIAIALYLMTYLNVSDYIIFPLQLVVGCILLVCLSELTRLESYLGLKSMARSYFIRR